MKIEALSVRGKNPDYNNPKYLIGNSSEPKSLRFWQPEAYEKLKDARFALVAAFCGSGKSILQVALGIHDVVKSDWKQKQLIVVPQSHIHQGFVGDDQLSYIPVQVDGIKYEWKIRHNFCEQNSEDILEKLKTWMLADPKSLSRNHSPQVVTGINAVASHQALSLVWNKMTDAEKTKACKHLTLRIDEAHHIKGVYQESEEGLSDEEKIILDADATNLGKICSFFIHSKDKTCKLHLTTATPYRGDKGIIISPEVQKQFSIYYLDWIDHWKTLGIEDFCVEYEQYKIDPINQVMRVIKAEPNQKHMIVVPSSGQKWRKNKEDINRLFEAIYKIVPQHRVLDLVTPTTQDRNKKKLLQEPKRPDQGESQYDVVVTCMLGREGTDWCPCNRLHNLACEASITLAVQTMGRPFRKYEGKANVRITYYIKQFVVPKKGMTRREVLTDRTNALLVCMQMDEMAHPILIPIIPESSKKKEDKKTVEPRHTTLFEVFGDQYQDVKESLIFEIETLEVKSAEEIDRVVDLILDQYDIVENRENIHDALRVLALRRLTPPDLHIDVAFLRKEGFDKICDEYKVAGRSIFFGELKSNDWTELRQILNNHKREWEVMYQASMAYAKEKMA